MTVGLDRLAVLVSDQPDRAVVAKLVPFAGPFAFVGDQNDVTSDALGSFFRSVDGLRPSKKELPAWSCRSLPG